MTTPEDIEKLLAKPIPTEARELLKTALEKAEETRAERLKHSLPDVSEPCIRYVPAGDSK